MESPNQMKKDNKKFTRRDLFKGAANAGFASALLPLTGFAATNQKSPIDNELISINKPFTDSEVLKATAVIFTPSVIYASEGVEINIYFDNIIFSNLPIELLDIDIICNKGRQYDKFWRITPQAADEGSTLFRIEINFAGKLIASKTSELIINGKSKGSGQSIRVLCIGDSTTAGGQYINIINSDYQFLESPSMTFLGTRGTAKNKHEGRGGWKFSQYAGDGGQSTHQFNLNGIDEAPSNGSVYTNGVSEFTITEINLTEGKGYIAGRRSNGTESPSPNGNLTKISGAGAGSIPYTNSEITAANPFWNLKTRRLDFKKYMIEHAFTMTSDDLITIHLGINDIFNDVTEVKLESIKADIIKMTAEFRAVVPRINIGLCLTIPPSISQDAFAVNYASGQTLKRYMENYKQLINFLLSNYDTEEMRASRLYCIGFNHCIDRINNFQKTTMKANARSTKNIDTWANGVHPDNTGYYQMGDALYVFIKSLVS